MAAVAMCAGLLWSASASALVHRGHEFGFTFEGADEQAFTKATGVAVNESTGDVYVVDAPRSRVEVFKPDGKGGYEFASSFEAPGGEAIAIDNDVSSSSHGAVYVSGIEKPVKKNEELEANAERNYLYKFTAEGEKLFRKSFFKTKEKVVNSFGETVSEEFTVELEEISGLAVDASGKLWVTWGEEGYIAAFTNELQPAKLIGTAIKEEVVSEDFECRSLLGFGVAPDDEAFYLRHERSTGAEECPEREAGVPAREVADALVGKANGAGAPITTGMTKQNSTGVAVDETNGDVYVDNVTSIVAFTGDSTQIQRFGAGSLTGGGALAVDHATETVFAVESGGTKIAVFTPEEAGAPPSVDSLFAQVLSPTSTALIAQIDGHGAATTYTFQYGKAACLSEPSSCATVSGSLPASFGDQVAEAKLEGLEPDTTYYYRVIAHSDNGTAESSQFADTFFTTLPSAKGLLPNHREWEMVSPPGKGGLLQAMSKEGAAIQASENGDAFTYGAENSGPAGETQGNRSVADQQFFSTRGSEAWATQTINTPHNKGEGFIPGQSEEYRVFSPDLSIALVEPELHKGLYPCEAPPLAAPLPGEECQGAAGMEKTMYLRADPPVAPVAAEKSIYEEAAKNSGYLAPGYLPLITGANNEGEAEGKKTHFGEALEFIDASSDLNHVVFESDVPLVKGAVGEGLYQWDSGSSQLRLVSELPEAGEVAVEPVLGGPLNTNSRNTISRNGSRTIFSSATEANSYAFLFVRDASTSPAKTIRVNAVQGNEVSEPSPAQRENEEIDQTHYQTASADGTRIFFTDTWPLTDDSNLHPTEASHPADLYEYNVTSGKLTDLTVSEHAGGQAAVLGTIPGVSEDGSYVYFVANGVLAPGASQGACPERVLAPFELEELPPGVTCNLYVSSPRAGNPGQRETRLIAALSPHDAADWGLPDDERVSASFPNLTYVTSRVSPGSGEYLAFMSQRSLTGYDNTDAVSKAADEEVFLYNAKLGRLVCASCNPSGAAPKGVFDKEASGEGLGLLVDRPEVWKNEWLAGSIPGWTAMTVGRATYQSRYLTASGRLFFNAADALVAQDQNQKEDVYQYEPQGAGDCESESGCVALISSGAATDKRESAFLDASASGNDVFFLTSEKLLAQDVDGAFDVYDARVCGIGGSGPCLPHVTPPAPACTGEGCKPPVSGQPSFAPSATANFSGPGNVPSTGVLPSKTKSSAKTTLTRSQKLSKALKKCRKQFKHSKKRRAACEKQARKKYGAKKSKAKKSSTVSRRSR